MASIIDSVEEHPDYLFDHLISLDPNDDIENSSGYLDCVAIDPFTDKIYVLILNSVQD